MGEFSSIHGQASPPPGSVVVSTWNHGLSANARSIEILKQDGGALEAVEAGVMVAERDSNEHSVGLSGYPDRGGLVTLDAAIMDHTGRAGSVACVRGIAHPISLARMVMQHTTHVMLVGEGAEQFARERGMGVAVDAPLHPDMLAAWEQWKEGKSSEPGVNRENAPGKTPSAGQHNHDTIGTIALDPKGRLAAACSTSGMPYKMRGRVGDSPIIGAGLFVDGEVGAAVCTGVGEIAMRAVASFLVVEKMRGGASPQTACEEAIARMIRITGGFNQSQVGLLALSREGGVGAYAIQGGFTYALGNGDGNHLLTAAHAI